MIDRGTLQHFSESLPGILTGVSTPVGDAIILVRKHQHFIKSKFEIHLAKLQSSPNETFSPLSVIKIAECVQHVEEKGCSIAVIGGGFEYLCSILISHPNGIIERIQIPLL